jgi:hypothetical protein
VVIRRCLAKDSNERWQSARDLEGELKWIAEGRLPAKVRNKWRWAVVTGLGVLAAIVLGTAWIPVTDGSGIDTCANWSWDGFCCIWAQRLEPLSKKPIH